MLPGLKTCLYNMDCLDALKLLPSQSVDSLVTDPPAGISFMGKDWDSDMGGSKEWIEWMFQVARQCRRVLKPGAHGLVWAIPRTSHWTATALEQAGFEIRDVVTHVFGSGFPKSLDISKAIDKAAGLERPRIPGGQGGVNAILGARKPGEAISGEAISGEAAEWQGWGTALKPASEHWILIRKSLAVKNVASNVLKHGTGGINTDASRIGVSANDPNHRKPSVNWQNASKPNVTNFGSGGGPIENLNTQGRFPANFVLSHNDDCDETCTDGCAVAELDLQSGPCKTGLGGITKKNDRSVTMSSASHKDRAIIGYADTATGASRFFYCAKTSKRERNEGLEGMPVKASRPLGISNWEGQTNGSGQTMGPSQPQANHHPTVKPQRLMEYLIRMVTPQGGTVLDPFMGSGSTGVAAKRLGFKFIGIEREKEYFSIARARVCRGKDL